MWPFKKSVPNLKDSGLFKGFTDWHSHILPGVDDGVKTMDEALEILQAYEKLGFKKIWLTPHIMEDYPNETGALKSRFEELKSKYKGQIELSLAAENMLDNLFEQRLESNDLLPIGEEGNHLLVETSYYTPPYAMEEMMDKAMAKGYFLILAHPERYRYMDKEDYDKLKDKGIKFQLNFLSLVGGYGETAQKKAEWLLSKGYVNRLGSDIHKLSSVIHYIDKTVKSDKYNDLLKSCRN